MVSLILYNTTSFILYILTVLCVFCLILEYELNITKKGLLPILGIFTLVAGVLSLIINKNFLIFNNCCLTLFFLLIYSKSKRIGVIGSFLVINLCILQLELYLDIIFYILAYVFWGKDLSIWIIDIAISIVLFISVAIVSLKIWRNASFIRQVKVRKRQWFVKIEIFIFIINLIIISAEYKLTVMNHNTSENLISVILFSIILFFFIFCGFIGYYLLIAYEKHKELISLNTRYLNQLNIYCDSLKSNNDELRKIRHDIRQHLYSIQILLSNDKTEDAKKYISKLLETTIITHSSRSGSLIIDSIIDQYQPMAMEHNINIILSGQWPANTTISDYDLCTIFYNLFVNAIEECVKISGKKNISVTLGNFGRYINISIKNPLSTSFQTIHQSSKLDKVNHGYGLKNVEQCVKENNGNIKILCTEDFFNVDIVIEGIK